MENKTKIGIVLGILLVLAGFGYIVMTKKQVNTTISQKQPIVEPMKQSEVQDKKIVQEVKQVDPKDIAQKVGTVSMVDPKFLTIEIVDGSLQAAITKDTKFFKRSESLEKTPIQASDIKVNMNVILKLNSVTGEIVEVIAI